ncbi:MAG: DNA ligase D [Myxococcota bacterium]
MAQRGSEDDAAPGTEPAPAGTPPAGDPDPSDGQSPTLKEYRAKRSGDRTAEPFGGHIDAKHAAAAAVGQPRLFVVQMHAARRLHWDVRLEIDGVLRSWAVPRGPSFDPSVKRLAVETEDHPIEYVDFEGVIPEGNYGAGAMIVWDRGVWIPLEPVGPGYDKGKLLFELRGHKLAGVWTLVRTKGTGGSKAAQGKEWLLIKKPDAAAGSPEPDEASVLSGLTIDELRTGSDRAAAIVAKATKLGAPERPVDARTVPLMHAQTEPEAFTRKGWVFELKYDGYRLVAARPGGQARLRYRSGADATAAFPEISRAIKALPFEDLVIDGEVCVLDPDARPNFQRLQKRAQLLRQRDIERAMREHPVTYYVFDVLAVRGLDLRGLPLLERKALLRQMLHKSGPVRYAEHIEEQGEALYTKIEAMGLEGVVGKKADSTYQSRRSPDWIRVRTEHTDDFIVVGYTLPEGSRVGLRALQLAAYVDGKLTSMGRVGTGFSVHDLQTLRDALDEHVVEEPACAFAMPHKLDVYVAPKMVVEIRYKHRTDDGMLRHPVFLRVRDDKSPGECEVPAGVADEPDEPDPNEAAAVAEPAPASPATEAAQPSETHTTGDATPSEDGEPPLPPLRRKVVISNPDKPFWPDDGYNKIHLIEFYQRISPWLLPYLEDRPLVMTRYPDGIGGKNFFQKNAPPFIPEWLRTNTMWSEHAQREIEFFVCNDVDSLVYLANLATIPLHVWGSRVSTLQVPDWCILDLDPKTAPFADVVQIALHIHALTEEIGMPAYIKTSGSTGLHVVMPMGGQCTYEQCRMFAEILARVVADELPKIATVERSMKARRGRVYIDFGQNGHGRLLVSPFSVRPKPGAPVSTPLTWDQVVPTLNHQAFTIANVPRLMAAYDEDPFAPVLGPAPDLQSVLAKLVPRLASS